MIWLNGQALKAADRMNLCYTPPPGEGVPSRPCRRRLCLEWEGLSEQELPAILRATAGRFTLRMTDPLSRLTVDFQAELVKADLGYRADGKRNLVWEAEEVV